MSIATQESSLMTSRTADTRVRHSAGRGTKRAGFLSMWRRYGIALLIGVATVGVKLSLAPLLTRDEPVLLFLGATLLAATWGGLGPGICVTLMGAVSDEYFFMAPYGTWHLNSPDQLFRLTLFVGEGCAISWMCARTLAARRSAEASAATALELQSRVTDIADHERRRLGHDLHDGLGQQLTGVALLTRRLQERLAAADVAEAVDAAALVGLVRDTLGQTHDLCRTLDPVMDDPQGLGHALESLAKNVGPLLGVTCRLFPGETIPRINPAAAIHLYRIAQEAISNAARHGQAKQIDMRLDAAADELLLQITDNGGGMTAGATAADEVGDEGRGGEGMGLRIMRYRAQLLGGGVEMGPGVGGGGTTVRCRVPLASITRPLGTEVGVRSSGILL